MKIISVVGARPQFIKCAPLSRELRKKHEEILIHTGQHYDAELSDTFFKDLDISKPNYNIGVGSGTHGEQTGRMLIELEKIMLSEKPDVVVVYGDTNSTLAGALSAAKLQIPVAHVEAGLRSFDGTMPEEINRVLADHISDLLFCPTQTAVNNLVSEGIKKGVSLVGDVMLDALMFNKDIAENKSKVLEKFGIEDKTYLVATIHRQSNTDDRRTLESIVDAFCKIKEELIFPLHPRTAKCLKKYGFFDRLDGAVRITKPLGYLDMLKLIAHARKILTDSGGMQKEAYLLNVPCITLRENTEWVETVREGQNILVGANKEKIFRAVETFEPKEGQKDAFGTVGASSRIVEILGAFDVRNQRV